MVSPQAPLVLCGPLGSTGQDSAPPKAGVCVRARVYVSLYDSVRLCVGVTGTGAEHLCPDPGQHPQPRLLEAQPVADRSVGHKNPIGSIWTPRPMPPLSPTPHRPGIPHESHPRGEPFRGEGILALELDGPEVDSSLTKSQLCDLGQNGTSLSLSFVTIPQVEMTIGPRCAGG